MSNYETKTGHPVLAVVLGILGILIALFATLLTGIIGGIVAGVLGIAALLIGFFGKKNGGKGIGGIVTGALAIILAIAMTVSSVRVYQTMKDKAAEYADEFPLVVKTLDNPSLGMIGMLTNMPKDESSSQELIDQFNKITDMIKADTAK